MKRHKKKDSILDVINTSSIGLVFFFCLACTIVVYAIAAFPYPWKHAAGQQDVMMEEKAEPQQATASRTTSGAPTTAPTATTGDKPDYSQLVLDYAGKRIHFNNCTANPSSLVAASGSKIMLDNGSSEPITVTVGSNSYTLGGLSYQIVTVTTGSASTNAQVNCQNDTTTKNNTSRVLVQP